MIVRCIGSLQEIVLGMRPSNFQCRTGLECLSLSLQQVLGKNSVLMPRQQVASVPASHRQRGVLLELIGAAIAFSRQYSEGE